MVGMPAVSAEIQTETIEMPLSVIVGARRSPMGKFLGTLTPLSAPQIGAAVAKDVLQSVDCPADAVDWASIGQVLQAGVGQNPARQMAHPRWNVIPSN